MEAVLRSKSLYYIVAPGDARAKEKRKLLLQIADKEPTKLAQIKLDKLKHEDQVIAIIQATIEPTLLNSIRGKTAKEAWTILKPVHLANVTLTVWQEMQTFRVKNHDGVCDYIIIMRGWGENFSRSYDSVDCPRANTNTDTMADMGGRLIRSEADCHTRQHV